MPEGYGMVIIMLLFHITYSVGHCDHRSKIFYSQCFSGLNCTQL